MTDSLQPNWELVVNLGDADPLDYGGFFVYRDTTGNYPAEAEVLEVDEDDATAPLLVYRFVLEPCTYTDGILSDNLFHPIHPAWFADKLGSVSRSVDMPEIDLIALLCSTKPSELGRGYQELTFYFGLHEFDDAPIEITRDEAETRYALA